MGQLHTHQISVQTDEDQVTVQVGGEGTVPGGFAKLFNRVVDSEAWARLSDAGRAAYIPLVRFADHRNQYRIQIGQAALMKYAGLSRSSIKRAVKDLLASRLIVLIEQGGVTPDGRNESNLYQLMVPVEPRQRAAAGGYAPADAAPTPAPASAYSTLPAVRAPAHGRFADGTGVGSPADPQGGRVATPSRFAFEPPVGPAVDPEPVLARPVTPIQRTPRGGVAGGPQLRSISEKKNISSSTAAPPPLACPAPEPTTDAAVLLEECGVERPVARQLAAAYPMQRVVDVVETMRHRRARGKCDNPGGFIRDALVKQWQTPQSVVDARAKADARARAEAASAVARQSAASQAAGVNAEQQHLDRLVDALDDDELDLLAAEVLKKYDGNSAVLAVLTRKPPRQCRLMKMEVAALLGRR
ncbi:MAG: hypothetical protein JWO31_3173 [Phycisphaerales bacterium]|nr:hypothetical protein [Phycisphaerales bacterium]